MKTEVDDGRTDLEYLVENASLRDVFECQRHGTYARSQRDKLSYNFSGYGDASATMCRQDKTSRPVSLRINRV